MLHILCMSIVFFGWGRGSRPCREDVLPEGNGRAKPSAATFPVASDEFVGETGTPPHLPSWRTSCASVEEVTALAESMGRPLPLRFRPK